MTSTTTWTAAPAGDFGLGAFAMRPCAERRPGASYGTAVPFAGERQLTIAPAGARLVVEVHVQKPIAPTHSTTLGIPLSREPRS